MAIKLKKYNWITAIFILSLIPYNKAIAEKILLSDLNGVNFHNNTTIPLSKYQGKIIYLDFWASWCKPCRTILPALQNLHDKYHEQNLVIIAVNIDEVKADAKDFLQKYPINYPQLYDPNGVLGKYFNIRVMPTGILIDTNGSVSSRHVGYRKGDIKKLENSIFKLINTPK